MSAITNKEWIAGWIHAFAANGRIQEGIYEGKLGEHLVLYPTPFCGVPCCPRSIHESEIDWCLPVIKMGPNTTEWDYRDALSKFMHKQ